MIPHATSSVDIHLRYIWIGLFQKLINKSNLKCVLWKRFHIFLEKFGNVPMIQTAQCSFFKWWFYGPWFSYNFSLSFSAEKLRLQEELFRMRSHRKDGEARKEHLLNRAKILQARAQSHKQKVNYFFWIHTVCKV